MEHNNIWMRVNVIVSEIEDPDDQTVEYQYRVVSQYLNADNEVANILEGVRDNPAQACARAREIRSSGGKLSRINQICGGSFENQSY